MSMLLACVPSSVYCYAVSGSPCSAIGKNGPKVTGIQPVILLIPASSCCYIFTWEKEIHFLFEWEKETQFVSPVCGVGPVGHWAFWTNLVLVQCWIGSGRSYLELQGISVELDLSYPFITQVLMCFPEDCISYVTPDNGSQVKACRD